MKQSLRALIVALAALLVLTACGGDGAGGGAEPAEDGGVTLVTTEFQFDPDTFSIAADADVTITIDNTQGVVEHDFTVDELGADILANPGEVVSDTVNAAAGTYEFYCSIPGHRAAGMEGVLTIG